MPNDDADRYRMMADECREQAERAHSPLDKERWLRLSGKLDHDGAGGRVVDDRYW